MKASVMKCKLVSVSKEAVTVNVTLVVRLAQVRPPALGPLASHFPPSASVRRGDLLTVSRLFLDIHQGR